MHNNNFYIPSSISSWLDYFQIQPPIYGGIDFFCLGVPINLNFVASWVATIDGLKLREKNEPVYQFIKILIPFGNKTGLALENLVESVFNVILEHEENFGSLNEQAQLLFRQNIVSYLEKKIVVEQCSSNELSELIKIIDNTEKHTAILLINGDLFASKISISPLYKVKETPINEGLRLWSNEDLWVANIASVISSVSEELTAKEKFLVITAQQETPVKKSNIKKLYKFDNVNFIFANESEENTSAERNAKKWLKLAADQKIDSVLEDIDKKISNEINRAVIKAQCLAAADHATLGFQLLKPFISEILSSHNPEFLVSMAKVVATAGERDVAATLLKEALSKNLVSQFSLETAFKIAKRVGAYEERGIIQDLLLKYYPLSEDVINREFDQAIEQNNFNLLYRKLDLYATNKGVSEIISFFLLLTEFFLKNTDNNFDGIIQSVRLKHPEYVSAATYYCGVYASRKGEYKLALKLFVSEDLKQNLEEFAVLELLSAIEIILISKSSTDSSNSEEFNLEGNVDIEKGFRRIVKYLSIHPTEGEIRNSFLKLVSLQSLGLVGISYLIKIVIEHDFSTLKVINKPSEEISLVKADDMREILEFYLSNIEQPSFLGISKLPEIKSKYSLSQIQKSFNELLEDLAYKGILDEQDLNFYFMILHIVIKLNQKLKTAGEFQAINTMATALIGVGNYQNARNLAEQALILSLHGKTDNSRKYAWLAFSDIYQRCHNKIESLIGLVCALQIKNLGVSNDEMFVQRVLLVRILRDFGFYAIALDEINRCREVAQQTNNPERSNMILGMIEAQIKLITIGGLRGENFRDERINLLNLLAEEVTILHKQALSSSNELFPTVLLLAQISRSLAEENSQLGSEATSQLLNSLEGTNAYFTNFALAIASNKPTFQDIQKLLVNLDKNRYLSDLATDISPIVQLSRIALTHADLNLPKEAMYLLEILSGLSINSPLTRDFSTNKSIDALDTTMRQVMGSVLYRDNYNLHPTETSLIDKFNQETNLSIQHPDKIRILEIESLLNICKILNEQNVSVFLIGLDSNEDLVVFSHNSKKISAHRELKSIYDSERYYEWLKLYPYSYADLMLNDLDAFHNLIESIQGIGITLSAFETEHKNPILFVGSSTLQSFPPNFYLIDNDYPIGTEHPIAIAPSLNWLHKVNCEKPIWNSKYSALILETDRENDPLRRLVEETRPILEDYGFSINNNVSELHKLIHSDISIIGGHGSLHNFDQYFKAVSNGGDARVSGLEIAKHLSRCNLVILFICSGGRIDQNPYSEATTGLPYEILNHGTRTVIASPYPIEAGIQATWLETFLANFFNGVSVVNSNYNANKAVSEKHNFNFIKSLAMNVFGDPLLTLENLVDNYAT